MVKVMKSFAIWTVSKLWSCLRGNNCKPCLFLSKNIWSFVYVSPENFLTTPPPNNIFGKHFIRYSSYILQYNNYTICTVVFFKFDQNGKAERMIKYSSFISLLCICHDELILQLSKNIEFPNCGQNSLYVLMYTVIWFRHSKYN
jgi:hypothetical protein